MRQMVFCVVLAARALAGQTPETVYGTVFGDNPLPAFDKGYLLFVHDAGRPDSLVVYGPDGLLMYRATLAFPDGRSVSLGNAAIDTDGTVVVGVAYRGPRGRGAGLAFLDRSGKQTDFIETGLYSPAHVCFAADHSIWTLGMQWDAADPEYSDRGDHPIIRHYTREGKPLGAFVSRAIFPPGLAPGGGHIGLWHIRAARDRIGAVVRPGQSSGHPELIEVDLARKMLGRWKLGPDPSGGRAYTESGNLYQLGLGPDERPWHLYLFDRATSTWRDKGRLAPSSEPDGVHLLLGAEGDQLVYSVGPGGSIRLRRMPAPE